MKSTSAARNPDTSATRNPANAPNRTATRKWSGIASWIAQTCSVVATYTFGLPIGGDVRREHGLRPSTPSCIASDMICENRECSA